jgi:transcriptional regulator with XRE-family HTH domain
MPADKGPVVQSALLCRELVRLRRERNLTQVQVAGELGWSPSKLIKIEGAHGSITPADLNALLTRYGVTEEGTREAFHARHRDALERGWWDAYAGQISSTYLEYVGYEAGAASIRQFQISLLPGLLQIRPYAEVVTEADVAEARRAAPVTELRLRRQSQLASRSAPPRQLFVIDEAAIRRHIGVDRDPAIMPDQLRSIARRAEQDTLVTVRVIPFGAGAHPGLFGPFTLLGFDGALPDILYRDSGRETFELTFGDHPRVSGHAADFEGLLERALTADESIELIRTAAEQMSERP